METKTPESSFVVFDGEKSHAQGGDKSPHSKDALLTRSLSLVRALPGFRAVRGFTLLELLIVLAIIGLLTSVALPHLKGLTRSNTMASANEQLLNDLALARQRAINGRSVVCVVFMPPVADQSLYGFLASTQQNQLLPWQYTAYALISERTVGDQPGRPTKKYLTNFKALPDGVFIAKNKFEITYPFTNALGQLKQVIRFDYKDFPYPTGDSPNTLNLPYIAFDPQGGHLDTNNTTRGIYERALPNCIIPLARGSIFLDRDATGAPVWTPASPREAGGNNSQDPNTYNEIEIDAVTGRALVDRKSL